MADRLQVTIVGLGLLGVSAGLALRRYEDKVYIVGHDKNAGAAARAKKMGAVDKTEWNLISAVSDADRVLLALPVDEIKATLAAIAADLKQGCVILDTADVKSPVLQWARELLPKEVHLVGGHPILVVENPAAESATGDLFQNKLFCLTPDARTDPAAVRLAADLAEAMGAKPFFLDPAEHDSMIAAVEHVPQILAGGLLEIVSKSSGWQDMRRLGGSQFYSSTLITSESGQAASGACGANREPTLHWLDQLIAELTQWRQRLADGDDEDLANAFDRSLEVRDRWVQAQASGQWDEAITPEYPTAGTMMRSLIGFRPPRTPPEKGKK